MRKISEISGVSVDHIPEAAFVPKKRFLWLTEALEGPSCHLEML